MHLRLATLGWLLLASAAAQAQPLVETIEVRLAEIDVVVVDRDGNPVGGLRADDFVIRENGRIQTVSNFVELSERRLAFDAVAEPDAGADEYAPRRPAPRHIVLVIDRLRLFDRANREAYFRALRDFVQDALRGEDRATVIEWRGGAFLTTVPFTRDEGPILDALNRIERDSSIRFGIPAYEVEGSGTAYMAEDELLDLDREMAFDARNAAQRAYNRVRRRIESVRAITTALAGLEGRKVMLLSLHRMPLDPGVEFRYEGRELRVAPLLDELVRDANASGVTIHAFWAEGLGRSMPGADLASASMGRTPEDDYRIAAVEAAAVESVAGRTGGQSGIGGVAAGARLADAVAQLDHSYSIAWRSDAPADGKPRKVDVRVKQPDLRVIARASYVEKSSEQRLEDQLLATALFSPQPSEIHPHVSVLPAVRDGRSRVRIPLDVAVPIGQLTLLPDGATHKGGFRVLVLPVDARGDLGPVVRESRPLEIPAHHSEAARDMYVTLSLELSVPARSSRAAVAVVDEITGAAGFVVTRLPPSD